MVQVKCVENAVKHMMLIKNVEATKEFTLNIPATRIGCRSSLGNGRFRSIFSIQSFTDRALATLRKIPVVSGPLR